MRTERELATCEGQWPLLASSRVEKRKQVHHNKSNPGSVNNGHSITPCSYQEEHQVGLTGCQALVNGKVGENGGAVAS